MSTTVKVFIVLILVMSLVFMAMQMTLFATRENWKRRWHDDTRALAEELKSSGTALAKESKDSVKFQNQVSSLNSLITDHQAKIKEQEGKITELGQTIQNRDLTIKKQETNYNALNDSFMAQSKSLEMVRQRNTELNHIAQVSRAVAFNLNVKLAEVEDDLNTQTTDNTRLTEDIAKITIEVDRFKARDAILRQNHPETWKELNDPSASAQYLQGVVAAVRNNPQGQQDLVVLTIGEKAKVQEGVEFIIFRGNQYIAKARIERVEKDMAFARVLPESWNPNKLPIQQGDLAQNRF